MLKELDRITLTWWFGHAVLLALGLFVVGAAVFLTPSTEAVSVLGWEVPVVCGWRRMTGIPCLGCGLTRSFTFMAHGHLLEAFRMNPIGPPFFLVVAAQIPWRLRILWRGKPVRPTTAAVGG